MMTALTLKMVLFPIAAAVFYQLGVRKSPLMTASHCIIYACIISWLIYSLGARPSACEGLAPRLARFGPSYDTSE